MTDFLLLTDLKNSSSKKVGDFLIQSKRHDFEICHFNEKWTATVNQGCSSIDFPIQNRSPIYNFSPNPFASCSKISNFFLKTNFLDWSKAKNPSCERVTFIFRVFCDRSNSDEVFSKKCTSNSRAMHLSTNFQNVIQDAVHIQYCTFWGQLPWR